MAVHGAQQFTLSNWAKRLDPDGAVPVIAEILNETNEVLDDLMLVEGNLPTGHRGTIRAGLPAPTWRLLNYGVPRSKASTVQVTDTAGMLEAYSEVDKALADLNGNAAAFRVSEDKPFVEAMSQEIADTLFYGNIETDPEKFHGLTHRYSSLAAANGVNVLDGGGVGNSNASIWLVTWDYQTCFCFFPKGSKGGLIFEDQGQVTLKDENGNPYEGYRSHYKWDIGLTLKDWRYVVRIANIDVSALTVDGATGAKLIQLMVMALFRLPGWSKGRKVFYCNRMISEYLHHQAMQGNNVLLSLDEAGGKPITRLLTVPIRTCDSLVNTEQAVLN